MFNCEWVVTLSSPDAGQNREERTVNKLIIRICGVSQELRSLLRDLIPELILSQKRHIHMGTIGNGSGVMSFCSTVNKLERKEENYTFIEICC